VSLLSFGSRAETFARAFVSHSGFFAARYADAALWYVAHALAVRPLFS
jgi:hypothetical protein